MVHTVAYILDGTLVLTVYNDPSKLKQRVPGTTGNQRPRCPDDHQIRQPIASLAFDSFGSHLLLNLAASTSAEELAFAQRRCRLNSASRLSSQQPIVCAASSQYFPS